MHLTDRGYITTSWNSLPTSSPKTEYQSRESLFQLTFKVLKDGFLKDYISINSDITTAEAYTPTGDLFNIDLQIKEVQAQAFSLQQNTPNPFKTSTTVRFTIPKEDLVQFQIINTQGIIVYQQEVAAASGEHEITIRQPLPPGTYLYRMSTSDQSLTKKMMILR
jgi:hypothetical protein